MKATGEGTDGSGYIERWMTDRQMSDTNETINLKTVEREEQ